MNNPVLTGQSRLDRYTRISELGEALQKVLQKGIPVVAFVILIAVAKLYFSDTPGWLGLVWIGAGTCIALVIWQSAGTGLPLLPLLALQHLAVYGIPLLNGNETISGYSADLIDRAGIEVLIFLVACSASWRFGMQLFKEGAPKAHMLRMFVSQGSNALNRIGITLITIAAGYELLNSLSLIGPIMDVLPSGTFSIVVALISAISMSGYFLVAMFIAGGEARASTRNVFWLILTGHLILLTASLLLSSVINVVGAVTIGLFWGSGKMPKKFLIICGVILSFLNIGKFEMRERYWKGYSETEAVNVGLSNLPGFYAEWMGHSAEIMTGQTQRDAFGNDKQKQTALARIDNLQNLLFVSDRVINGKISVLEGETYAIIPPLLIPRILWPGKPRAHEGQILLNIHFGRQSRVDSLTTYIAWGLLPEAYGNFGPILGAMILGLILGLFAAWIEKITSTKPLLSMEGMVTFALFIGIASSFEMVSSVLITSLFQSAVMISLACIPFVQSMKVDQPAATEYGDDT